MRKIFYIFLLISSFSFLNAQHTQFRSEAAIVFSHFQQQVKMQVGDPRGERLINEFELGIWLSGSYAITEYFSAGLFLRVDRGERAMAKFAGFNSEGKAITTNELGGTYTELWFGPLLQLNWKMLSADIGYALTGFRDDKGRGDIPSSSGDTESSFSLHPSIAWLMSLGGRFNVYNNLDVLFKIEYRARYYNERGGNPLIDNIEHGTQSISPIIGVGLNF
jgi:hypothetical protein